MSGPTRLGATRTAAASRSDQLLFLTEEQLRQGIELMFFAYRDFTSDPDAVLARYTPWRDLAALVAAARRPHEPPWLRVDIDQGQFFVGVLYDETMALLGPVTS